MEEVWLEWRAGDEDSSIHLHDIPSTPTAWLNNDLAAKWVQLRDARRVVTAALELQRVKKIIGSSLEAAPVVYVEDAALRATLRSVAFEDVCITSTISLRKGSGPPEAFRLPEIPGIAVLFYPAEGEKCQRCWKILPDVGQHAYPGTCLRCTAALG